MLVRHSLFTAIGSWCHGIPPIDGRPEVPVEFGLRNFLKTSVILTVKKGNRFRFSFFPDVYCGYEVVNDNSRNCVHYCVMKCFTQGKYCCGKPILKAWNLCWLTVLCLAHNWKGVVLLKNDVQRIKVVVCSDIARNLYGWKLKPRLY